MSRQDIEGILGEELTAAREAYENAKARGDGARNRDLLNAYGLALRRFNAFVSEGIVPPDLEGIRKRPPATSGAAPGKADEPAA